MTRRIELSRITVDIPKASHKKLKAIAALQGVSMREVINNLIDQQISGESVAECSRSHEPNEETVRAIEEVKKRKGLKKAKDAQDLFKKLGI